MSTGRSASTTIGHGIDGFKEEGSDGVALLDCCGRGGLITGMASISATFPSSFLAMMGFSISEQFLSFFLGSLIVDLAGNV